MRLVFLTISHRWKLQNKQQHAYREGRIVTMAMRSFFMEEGNGSNG